MSGIVQYIPIGIAILSLLFGVLGFVISAIVLPIVTYIWKKKDKDDEARDIRLRNLEVRDISHDIQLTKHEGELEKITFVFNELRELRDKMDKLLSKEEFRQWVAEFSRRDG